MRDIFLYGYCFARCYLVDSSYNVSLTYINFLIRISTSNEILFDIQADRW